MSYEAEDTKQKLIEAAREQLYKKGISNTTLEKITKQAFVQPSAVSYYFGGKRGLVENVIEGFYDRIYHKVSEITDAEEMKPILWIYVLWHNISHDHNIAKCMMEFLSMDVTAAEVEPTMRFCEFVDMTRRAFGLPEEDENRFDDPYYYFLLNNHTLYGMMKYALRSTQDPASTALLLARTDMNIKAVIAGVKDLDIVREKCLVAEKILEQSEVRDLTILF